MHSLYPVLLSHAFLCPRADDKSFSLIQVIYAVINSDSVNLYVRQFTFLCPNSNLYVQKLKQIWAFRCVV